MSLLAKPHAANDRELVGNPRLQRQMFADIDAGHVGTDGPKIAAIFGGRVRLHVIHIHVARPTVEVDHDDGLVRGECVGMSLGAKEVGEREPANTEGAYFKEIAPRHAIAEAMIGAEDVEHFYSPLGPRLCLGPHYREALPRGFKHVPNSDMPSEHSPHGHLVSQMIKLAAVSFFHPQHYFNVLQSQNQCLP